MIVLPGELRTCDRGALINVTHGYDLHWVRNEKWGFWPFRWSKAIHTFQVDLRNPITWVDKDGMHWQPDRHEEETDLGSIPPPLRSCFPQDEFEPGYVFHDSAYKHGGLYCSVTLDGPYEFEKVTRKFADNLLADIIMALGGGACRRGIVWSAVRCGGGSSFNTSKGG
jgi:hypothetical protein